MAKARWGKKNTTSNETAGNCCESLKIVLPPMASEEIIVAQTLPAMMAKNTFAAAQVRSTYSPQISSFHFLFLRFEKKQPYPKKWIRLSVQPGVGETPIVSLS